MTTPSENPRVRRSFVATIVVGMVLFSLLSGTFFYLYSYSKEVTNANTLQTQLVNTVREQTEVGIFTKNSQISHGVVESLLVNPIIQAVRITAINHFRIEKSQKPGDDFSAGTAYPIYSPVDHKELIGFLTVILNNTYVHQTEHSLPFSILIALQDIIAAAMLVALFYRHLTERRAYEAALLKTKNKLQGILGAIPDLLFEVDITGRYIDYHSPRVDLLAIPADQIIGNNIRTALPPDVAAIGLDALHEANEKGFSLGKQYELTLPYGVRWFELSVARKPDETDDLPHFIAIARDITDRKLQESALIQAQVRLTLALESERLALERVRQLSFHIDQTIENERKRLAIEIHDELGSSLTAVSLNLASLLSVISAENSGKYQNVMQLIRQMLQTTRRISVSLRPPILDRFGLKAALESVIANNHYDFFCKITEDSYDEGLDETQRIVLFRICQETLTNVARHAAASYVTIETRRKGDHWILTVSDNGQGFPAEEYMGRTTSFGLSGMWERTRYLGGELKVESSTGKGTRVIATIPVKSVPPDMALPPIVG